MNLDTLLFLVPRMVSGVTSDKENEVEIIRKRLVNDTTNYVEAKMLNNDIEECLRDLKTSYKDYQKALQELEQLKKAVAEFDTAALVEEIRRELSQM